LTLNQLQYKSGYLTKERKCFVDLHLGIHTISARTEQNT